ncbi:hypothetical protein E2C01_095688 [Portunus trituberculatus]|uniref:Uncharacterized protein n=1 Tax=Portunus trituberculatus TaxID=210409 RepID=A0A5B7K4N7_PORTR|nr:hypothetical protein [Portunus trituberculatus]
MLVRHRPPSLLSPIHMARQGRPGRAHTTLHLREPHGGLTQDFILGPPVGCQRGNAPVIATGWRAVPPHLTISSQWVGQAVCSLVSDNAPS